MAGSVTHSDWKDPVCPRCDRPWDDHGFDGKTEAARKCSSVVGPKLPKPNKA
jgi:hypothetical protein